MLALYLNVNRPGGVEYCEVLGDPTVAFFVVLLWLQVGSELLRTVYGGNIVHRVDVVHAEDGRLGLAQLRVGCWLRLVRRGLPSSGLTLLVHLLQPPRALFDCLLTREGS